MRTSTEAISYIRKQTKQSAIYDDDQEFINRLIELATLAQKLK